MADLSEWMKSGRYLPPALRDFHDQKAVFKTMHTIVDCAGHEMAGKVDLVTGQCYVIDLFLWFMAKRGYTLQRSRARLPFASLDADVAACEQRQRAAFASMFTNHPTQEADK